MTCRTCYFLVEGYDHKFTDMGKPGNTDTTTALGWRRKFMPGAKITTVWVEK